MTDQTCPVPTTPPLLAHAESPVPARCPLFLTQDWFDILEQHGMPSGTTRNDALIEHALRLPLTQSRGSFHALASYYSADYGMQDGVVVSMTQALQLADWFRSQGARHIELRPMRDDAPLLRMLMDALRSHGYLSDSFHVSTNWYLPCSGMSWAGYLASRPSRLANTLRRCRKRLEGEAGFRLRIASHSDETEQMLRDYAVVYAQSWKESEPYPDFIPQLCRMCARHGWLRLGVLYLHGEPAAAQIWFVKDGTASIYKLAYDSRFAKLGVGTVLTAALTEHVLEVDQVSEIDFLTGDDAYKAEWMSHSRTLVGLLAFNTRSPSGLLQAALHFGRRWLRNFKSGMAKTR
ncbi:MAG: family N-acetyltransferase [Rhodocyclales bacterium]|nr:family N-acetyltransferase [Rhodocyclales bacterium]